jgi:hypothetical protein
MTARALTALVVVSLLASPALAQDPRQLATLPPASVESLREEMRDNLVALNEILSLVVAGKVKEAGVVAEQKLGLSARGRHRDKPMDARPGRHMPAAMHDLGMKGHEAASAFAAVAATGDREKALAALPGLNASCVSCHLAFRVR